MTRLALTVAAALLSPTVFPTTLALQAWTAGPRRLPLRHDVLRAFRSVDAMGGVRELADLDGAPPGQGVFASQDWLDAWRTCEEVDYIADVEGPLPAELHGGTLFRAGPGRFERGAQRYSHVLDGDGYLLRIEFLDAADGRRISCAAVRGRFVKTFWWEQEEEAGRVLFRNTFGTQPANPLRNALNIELKNVANTNAVAWGGRLLALWEAGQPYEVDSRTLDTLGPTTLGGITELGPDGRGQPIGLPGLPKTVSRALGFGTAFTAHPHVDPTSNRLCGFAWNQLVAEQSLRLVVREFDDDFQSVCETEHVMEGCSLAPHDWALTPDYYVWAENRLQMDLPPYVFGTKGPAQVLKMRPEAPVRLHIVPRPQSAAAKRGEKARTLDCPPHFAIHFSHAAQSADGRRIELFSGGWPAQERNADGSAPAFLGAWSGEAPSFQHMPVTNYFKTVVELDKTSPAGGKVLSHEPFPDSTRCIEHPHVAPAFECGVLGERAPRFSFMSFCNEAGTSSAPQGWVRVDLETGEVKTHVLPGLRSFAEELVLVPKDNGATSESVWLLGLAYHAERRTSALHVIDGDSMETQCVLWLKHASPHGLHGSWVGGASRRSRDATRGEQHRGCDLE